MGKLLVAAELVAGDVGHDFFVGHAEAEVRAFAVLEAEHVFAHDGPAAGLAPQVGGMDGGQEKFLADLVHLVADDGNDAVDGALAKEEVGINAGAELADVAGADEEFVAGHFRVSGGLAEGGNEEFGPAVHGCLQGTGCRVQGTGAEPVAGSG